jgi:hypothetical protein
MMKWTKTADALPPLFTGLFTGSTSEFILMRWMEKGGPDIAVGFYCYDQEKFYEINTIVGAKDVERTPEHWVVITDPED